MISQHVGWRMSGTQEFATKQSLLAQWKCSSHTHIGVCGAGRWVPCAPESGLVSSQRPCTQGKSRQGFGGQTPLPGHQWPYGQGGSAGVSAGSQSWSWPDAPEKRSAAEASMTTAECIAVVVVVGDVAEGWSEFGGRRLGLL